MWNNIGHSVVRASIPTFERHVIARIPFRRIKQQIPSKRLYKFIKLHGVISHTNVSLTFTVSRTSILKALNLKHKLSVRVKEQGEQAGLQICTTYPAEMINCRSDQKMAHVSITFGNPKPQILGVHYSTPRKHETRLNRQDLTNKLETL